MWKLEGKHVWNVQLCKVCVSFLSCFSIVWTHCKISKLSRIVCRMCVSSRFWWQRAKSARIKKRCIIAWYKGQKIFMGLGEMFTRTVSQSHRKESKREGEIFFFLQQRADTPPRPYLMLHCAAPWHTASSTQVRGKILDWESKSTEIWPFCSRNMWVIHVF